MATTLTFVKAKNWEISSFLTSKAQFICGDDKCGKWNAKIRVQIVPWKDHKEDLATAQCKWCGTFNAFFSGNRPIVADYS